MGLRLRFQSSGAAPGGRDTIDMSGGVLTIGRGEDNDLPLPDPERTLSKRHCVLEERGDDYILMDISTNGTFLNYGSQRLGDLPTPLNDGDIITLGPYELRVEISAGAGASRPDPYANIAPPIDDTPVSPGSAVDKPHTNDFVGLLDDPAGKDGGDFLDDLLGPVGGTTEDQRKPQKPSWDRAVIPEDPLDIAPPLPDGDEPFFTEDRKEDVHSGDSVADHSASASDAFRPAQANRAVIPDDWDLDLSPGASTPAADDPFGAPAEKIPEDPFAAPADDRPGSAIPEDPFAAPSQPAGSDPLPRPAQPMPDDPLEDVLGGALDGQAPETPSAKIPGDPLDEIAPPASAEPARPAAEPAAQPNPPQPPAPTAAPAAMSAPASAADAAAARAFLEAAGVAHLNIPDQELPAIMAKLGNVFQAMVAGMRDILMTRASIKGEFRMNQTMIRAGGNNPLKFSISPEQAIEAMVKPPATGYQDAQSATTEALNDIKAHEIAMMTGMEAALKDLLARLDPEKLTQKIETKSGLGDLLSNKKARYWETYAAMYSEIAREAEDDFQSAFGREFARAYEDQLKKL